MNHEGSATAARCGIATAGVRDPPAPAVPPAPAIAGYRATAVRPLGKPRRGWPADYDAWAAAGNTGWSFNDLLPVFCAVETDTDFANDWHGTTGPVPVSRLGLAELGEYPRAFLTAAAAAGHPQVADHNRPGALGVGPLPRNVRNGTRMSTALTYLAPARPRPNLEIRPDTLVDRVLLSGDRAHGVRLHTGERVEADAVVLAAGAYGSPAILLRSGIGPAEQLRQLDLPVAADLPGVGANLVDHPLVSVDLPATPGPGGPTFQVLLTLRSPLANATGPLATACRALGVSPAWC